MTVSETIGPSATQQRPKDNGGGSVEVAGFRLNDERGIGLQVYSVLSLVAEILFLQLKMILVWIEAAYRLIVPVEEKEVKGEIALITGTGHGMGKELALQLSALGTIIICVDINEKTNNETAKEIKARGGKAHAIVCDVTDIKKVEEMANQIRNTIGEVSILINNAGIMPCHSFLTHREDEIKREFEINVYAHFWLLKAFLPSMISRNHGHVVALSSMAGIVGNPNLVPYCGTKFAVRGIMEALHEELRIDPRGLEIKFTTIYPYIVDTGLCHKPRIRFENLMKIVKPEDAAAQIITAMRRNYVEASVPANLLYINNVCRNMPNKISILLKDFLDAGVDAHDM